LKGHPSGLPDGRLFSVCMGDLAYKLGPGHVHRPVDFAGFRPRIVLEYLHHQGCVVIGYDVLLGLLSFFL
jgi:hypothetical protein